MRRAIAVMIGGGLALGGTLPIAGMSPVAPARAPAHAGPPALAAARMAGTRTVVYAGYEIAVPASWPVYRLDTDPGRCVRYDVHAVYLGTPGVNQQCPARLIGRTGTVSIRPAGGRQFAAAGGAVSQDAGVHALQVEPGGPARSAIVTATYGTDRALVSRVLATLHPAPAWAPDTPALPGAGQRREGRGPVSALSLAAWVARVPQPPGVSLSWHGLPASWPSEIVEPPPMLGRPQHGRPRHGRRQHGRPRHGRPLLGFDTCAAPSLATMRAWRKGYAVAGIYIGGVNAACYGGNLTASWIRRAAAMGWSMLPAYVGPQAPCYRYGTTINRRRAAQEGTRAAQDAAWDAWRLRLPARSPVYYDMEAYNSGNRACRAAVLTFLGAWTRQLNHKGYTSGVYSSLGSGIADLQAARAARLRGFTPPQAIWYAKWDRHRELHDRVRRWPPCELSKQYLGPHNVTLGGVTMNIDTDLVGGPTAR